MKKSRKIYLFLSVLLVISVFAACNSTKAPSSSSTQQASSAPADISKSAEAVTSAPAQEPVTISYFSYFSDYRDELQVALETFTEKNPTIKVDFSVAPVSDYPQLLKTQVASGDGPDVFSLWPGLSYVTYYAKNGHLMDLSNEEWVKNIVPGAMSTITYEDKIYAQPIRSSVVGITYNKDIYKNLSIEIPQTWEEFLDVCQKIKDSGITPLALALKTDWPGQFLPIYAFPCNILYSQNPQWDKQLFDGEVTFSDSDYKKCFEMFMDIDARGYFNETPLGVSYDQAVASFVNQETAMSAGVDSFLTLTLTKDPDFEVGMYPVPAPAGFQTTVPVGGNYCNVIYAKTKNADAAKSLLDYFSTQEAYDQVTVFRTSISLLSNIEVDVHPEIINNMVPAINKSSYSFTNLEWVPGIQEGFQKGYQELFAGVKTIEQMLSDVDKIAETNIANFKES